MNQINLKSNDTNNINIQICQIPAIVEFCVLLCILCYNVGKAKGRSVP